MVTHVSTTTVPSLVAWHPVHTICCADRCRVDADSSQNDRCGQCGRCGRYNPNESIGWNGWTGWTGWSDPTDWTDSTGWPGWCGWFGCARLCDQNQTHRSTILFGDQTDPTNQAGQPGHLGPDDHCTLPVKFVWQHRRTTCVHLVHLVWCD